MATLRTAQPVDRKLLKELGSARWAISTSVGVGLVSTAAVVVQAVALAGLLAGAMGGAHDSHTVSRLVWLAVGASVRGLCALASEVFGRLRASSAKAEIRARLIEPAVCDVRGESGVGAGAVAAPRGGVSTRSMST